MEGMPPMSLFEDETGVKLIIIIIIIIIIITTFLTQFLCQAKGPEWS